MILHARSADLALLRAVRAGGLSGRIHSIFDRALNIEVDGGRLVTLASRDLDDAPHSARLDTGGFAATHGVVGEPVRPSGTGLRIGAGVEVVFASARPWRCRLPAYPVAAAPPQPNLLRAVGLLHAPGVGGSFPPVPPGEVGDVGHGNGNGDGEVGDLLAAARGVLARHSAELLAALEDGRHADAGDHAVSMVGLGPGLTPSGDDYLVGLFAVLHVDGSPCRGWLGGGRDVVARAATRTHAISLAALHQAARGRVRQSIVDLVGALLEGTPDTVDVAMRRVLAIGSSSGADIAAGLLAGLELNRRVGAAR